MRIPKYRKHSLRDLGFSVHKNKRTYFPGAYKSEESLAAYADFIKERCSVTVELPPETSAKLVAELMARYLDYAKDYYPSGTQGEYSVIRSAIKLFIAKHATDPIETFTAAKFKAWRDSLIPSQKHSLGYINQCARKIKRAFKWGMGEGIVPEMVSYAVHSIDPLKPGRCKARTTPKRKPVPREWFDEVLNEVPPQIADMMRLQWFTGARPGSVCKAKPEQFTEVKGDTLWLWRPRHKTEYRDVELILPIGRRVQKLLEPYLKNTKPNKHIFNPRNSVNSRRYNDFYVTRTYQQAIDRAIERINKKRAKAKQPPMPHWTPHQIRHARGHEVRDKYGLEAAQAVLGHESIESTQIYSARQLELAKKVAKESG